MEFCKKGNAVDYSKIQQLGDGVDERQGQNAELRATSSSVCNVVAILHLHATIRKSNSCHIQRRRRLDARHPGTAGIQAGKRVHPSARDV